MNTRPSLTKETFAKEFNEYVGTSKEREILNPEIVETSEVTGVTEVTKDEMIKNVL